MKYTNKSVILDENIYNSLIGNKNGESVTPTKTGEEKEPLLTEMSRLEKELGSILANKSMSSDEKFIKYQEVFSKYKNLEETVKKPVKVVVESTVGPVKEIELSNKPSIKPVYDQYKKQKKLVVKEKQTKEKKRKLEISLWKKTKF